MENQSDNGGPALFQQTDTGEYVAYEPPKPPSFTEQLPEQFREHEYFKGVENTQQLAEAYANARKGLPVVPEDYQAQFPDGFDLDEETFNGFKQAAKEAGLTQTQFERVVNFEVARSQRLTEQMRNDVRQHREESETALKKEWGANYDQKLETAKRVFNKFADDTIRKMVEDTRFGDNPEVIRFMAKIGEVLSEDVLIEQSRTSQEGGMDRDIAGRPMLTFPSMEKKK